jgi:hypothetical protein
MCDDPAFDSARARAATRQMTAIRQKQLNLPDGIDMAHSHLVARGFLRKKSDILGKGERADDL